MSGTSGMGCRPLRLKTAPLLQRPGKSDAGQPSENGQQALQRKERRT